MSTSVIDGNHPVTGHIISITIGGKNGEPKQVVVVILSLAKWALPKRLCCAVSLASLIWPENEAGYWTRTISYMAERVVGTGSFGVIVQAKCLEIVEAVAIKVLQDRRYKNRELQLMRTNHAPDLANRWIHSLAAHARRPFLEREKGLPQFRQTSSVLEVAHAFLWRSSHRHLRRRRSLFPLVTERRP